MDGESLFCSNVNHMRFLSLYILRGGASYIFFCCLRRVLYSSVFCLSEYIGKGGNWKRKSSHFFLCIPTLFFSLQTFVCETECGPILAFCQASCSPSSPHSQSNCAFVEASQGSRELDYSVIQLYFRWSCDVLWIEGALDIGKTGAVLTAPLLLAEIFWTALLLRILGNMPENRVFFVQFFFIFLGF